MALTSRSTFLASQLTTLEAELVEIKAKGEGEEWVKEQILETKERVASCQERFRKWDIENELRRHNYIGLVSIHGMRGVVERRMLTMF